MSNVVPLVPPATHSLPMIKLPFNDLDILDTSYCEARDR